MFDNLPNFQDVLDSLSDPQRLHAIAVHIPIAISVIGLLLLLGVTLTGSKSAGLRWTCVFVYLVGCLAALWTVQTGEGAEAALNPAPTGAAHEVLEKHAALAQYYWCSLGAVAVLVIFSSVRVTWFRAITLLLALVAGVASVGWVASIAHHGGEMVYKYGIGVGQKPADNPAPPSTDNDKKKGDDKKVDEKKQDENKDGKSNDEPKERVIEKKTLTGPTIFDNP